MNSNRKRRINNLTSPLPRKRTIKMIFKILLLIGFLFIHYKSYFYINSLDNNFFELLGMTDREARLIGLSPLILAFIGIFYMTHIIGIIVIILYNFDYIVEVFNKYWNMLPD